MLSLPSSLSRRAIIRTFDQISPVAWEKLFEREYQNGLAKLRVPGDLQDRTYYSTDGVIHWLIRNDRYTLVQIRALTSDRSTPAPMVRTHVLAG